MGLRLRFAILGILLLWPIGQLQAEFSRRLVKAQSLFIFPQVNISAGYDSANPRKSIDWANRGANTQVALEFLYKDLTTLQRGYIKFLSVQSATAKAAVEWPMRSDKAFSLTPRFRLLNTWVRFATKWDRTSIWIGHKPFPYGHNPRLDPDLAFLPNQSNSDLGFGRDKGIFFKTPLSKSLDLELSMTAGMGDTFDWFGGWLAVARIGSPTFYVSELGFFALGGKIQSTSGPNSLSSTLRPLYRVGVDWVYKHAERVKIVTQVSAGQNLETSQSSSSYRINVLNSLEWFASSNWTFGMTNITTLQKPESGELGTMGEVFVSLSFAPTRTTRIRLNPFLQYAGTDSTRRHGGYLQACYGCGLRK